jgi:hypothetical protein
LSARRLHAAGLQPSNAAPALEYQSALRRNVENVQILKTSGPVDASHEIIKIDPGTGQTLK